MLDSSFCHSVRMSISPAALPKLSLLGLPCTNFFPVGRQSLSTHREFEVENQLFRFLGLGQMKPATGRLCANKAWSEWQLLFVWLRWGVKKCECHSHTMGSRMGACNSLWLFIILCPWLFWFSVWKVLLSSLTSSFGPGTGIQTVCGKRILTFLLC